MDTFHLWNATADNMNASAASNHNSPMDTFLIDSYQRNRSIQNPAYAILIAMYGCLIALGSVGNTMVMLAVIRKPSMRTARNMFIVNLAVSGEWEGGRRSLFLVTKRN